MLVFWNGAFTRGPLPVAPTETALTFGFSVYDVTYAIGGRLFEFGRHHSRLLRSAAALELPLPPALASESFMRGVAQRLLRANKHDGPQFAAMFYVQVSAGASPMRSQKIGADQAVSVLCFTQACRLDRTLLDHGMPVRTVPDYRWRQCDVKTTQLLPAVREISRAARDGFGEILWVDPATDRFLEGGHTNLFFVVHGVLRTHPESNRILPGITRRIVLDLARDAGIPVRERAVTRAEAEVATEAFLTSTTWEVMPIASIDGRRIGDGSPLSRPITRQLANLFIDRTERVLCLEHWKAKL